MPDTQDSHATESKDEYAVSHAAGFGTSSYPQSIASMRDSSSGTKPGGLFSEIGKLD